MYKTALELCKAFEGCRLTAYRDPAGVLTIGYGHTAGVYEGQKISQLQAEALLADDLRGAFAAVDAKGIAFSASKREALASFTFNCGPGNLTKLCTNRTVEEIGEALALYIYAGGKQLPGLVRRRAAEQELYFSEEVKDMKTYGEIPLVKSGSRGPIVAAVQAALVKKGYDVGNAGIDGICGARTVAAIKDAQRDAGIAVDGIAGPNTYDAIFVKE